MKAIWRWFRSGQSAHQIATAAYWAGYGQALEDARALDLVARADEAGTMRQPYPNE